MTLTAGKGDRAVTEVAHSSIYALHKLWARLENELHELALTMQHVGIDADSAASLRERQGWLLLEISAVVAEIRDAPATTLEDHLALLDVVLEHETDLAGDIGFYGPRDFPMLTRVLRALAERVPGFEFNSLRRWLSSPGQYEQVMGNTIFIEPASEDAGASEPIGFGEP